MKTVYLLKSPAGTTVKDAAGNSTTINGVVWLLLPADAAQLALYHLL